MQPPWKKLSDIVKDVAGLREKWAVTKPAADLDPLPRGEYAYALKDIRPDESKRGTPRLKITLTVTQGEYTGRAVFHDAYLTEAALPYTLRSLGKVGLGDQDAIDRGVRPGIVVRARIALRARSDGEPFNEIRTWELAAVKSPAGGSGPAPGMPPAKPGAPPRQPAATPWAVDLDALDSADAKGDDGPAFDFGAEAVGGDQ